MRDAAESGVGFRHADEHHDAVVVKEIEVGVVVVPGRDRIEDEVKASGILDENVLMPGGNEIVGAEFERLLALARRVAEHGDVGAKRITEFHGHVAQAAKSDHGKLVAGLQPETLEWRIGGDAGAE